MTARPDQAPDPRTSTERAIERSDCPKHQTPLWHGSHCPRCAYERQQEAETERPGCERWCDYRDPHHDGPCVHRDEPLRAALAPVSERAAGAEAERDRLRAALNLTLGALDTAAPRLSTREERMGLWELLDQVRARYLDGAQFAAPAERPDTGDLQAAPSDLQVAADLGATVPAQGAGDTPDREQRADCGHVQHENWQGRPERVGQIGTPDLISRWEPCPDGGDDR